MFKIDAHQHFWIFDPVRDSWISDEMNCLKSDFLPSRLIPLMAAQSIQGCIAVQADQSEAESLFLLELGRLNPFIKGVVGWVDLSAGNIEERLAWFSRFNLLKGFRHILQGESNQAFMLGPAFKHGISALKPYGFTYDILIGAGQLHYLPEFLSAFPDQPFVLDHMAKPPVKSGEISQWKRLIREAALYPNLSCKVSGLVTEASWHSWKPADFRPAMDVVFDAFGPERLLFGSDWPVCTLAAAYGQATGLLEQYCTGLTTSDREKLWGGNAIRFYGLDMLTN